MPHQKVLYSKPEQMIYMIGGEAQKIPDKEVHLCATGQKFYICHNVLWFSRTPVCLLASVSLSHFSWAQHIYRPWAVVEFFLVSDHPADSDLSNQLDFVVHKFLAAKQIWRHT